jgi:hypothetical protein
MILLKNLFLRNDSFGLRIPRDDFTIARPIARPPVPASGGAANASLSHCYLLDFKGSARTGVPKGKFAGLCLATGRCAGTGGLLVTNQ